MDRKGVVIRQTPNSGSYYFNCKGTFSMVLLVPVATNHKIIFVDVSCKGRVSDGTVFRNFSLSTAIKSNMLNMPSERIIGDGMETLPYVIVAGDAFLLRMI